MKEANEDLTGQQFGKLKVLSQAEDYIDPHGVHYIRWLCECSCAEHKRVEVLEKSLKKQNGTRSCGCLRKEFIINNFTKNNPFVLNFEDEHGKYGIGYCSNTGSEFYFDMEDYNKIKDYCWIEHIDKKRNYVSVEARDKSTGKVVKIHQIIFGKNCDHKDRNPLNNRKYNLRKASFSENSTNQKIQNNNTSGFI